MGWLQLRVSFPQFPAIAARFSSGLEIDPYGRTDRCWQAGSGTCSGRVLSERARLKDPPPERVPSSRPLLPVPGPARPSPALGGGDRVRHGQGQQGQQGQQGRPGQGRTGQDRPGSLLGTCLSLSLLSMASITLGAHTLIVYISISCIHTPTRCTAGPRPLGGPIANAVQRADLALPSWMLLGAVVPPSLSVSTGPSAEQFHFRHAAHKVIGASSAPLQSGLRLA